MMVACLLLASVLFETTQGGVSLTLESETKTIDPARSVFVQLTAVAPRGVTVTLPDLRARVKGFSLAEDFAEEPQTDKSGAVTQVVNWRLVPEPCAREYKIRPFVLEVAGGPDPFIGGPVYFENPPPREPVTGEMEVSPTKDLPPLSWKLVGQAAVALALLGVVACALILLVKYLVRRVKEHRMSPIERAWAELDRLLKKGLPGRGRYKDFYVELTMVVRRYIQRKYGIRAPNLTTEEFLRDFTDQHVGTREELRKFLESADLVKFAGVEATPEMADSATDSARGYLKSDATEATK